MVTGPGICVLAFSIRQGRKSEQPGFWYRFPLDSQSVVVVFEVVRFRGRVLSRLCPRYTTRLSGEKRNLDGRIWRYQRKSSLHAGFAGQPSITSLLWIAPRSSLRKRFWHVACGEARVSLQVLVHHWRVLLGRLCSLVQVFLRSCVCVRGHFALRDGVLMFSFKYEANAVCWNLSPPSSPCWGSRGDGNVASSLCAPPLPAQRPQPGRWCTLLRVSHRCMKFPA